MKLKMSKVKTNAGRNTKIKYIVCDFKKFPLNRQNLSEAPLSITGFDYIPAGHRRASIYKQLRRRR